MQKPRARSPLADDETRRDCPLQQNDTYIPRDTANGEIASVWFGNQGRLAIVGLVLVACLIGAAWLFRDHALEVAGYPGIFLVNFVGAVSLILPIPGLGLIATCGLSVQLNPLALGLLATSGETLGEWSGYVIGYGGHTALDRFGWYRRVRPTLARWMLRRGTLILFVVSVVPNPVFDIVGIAAGSVQYPFRRFMAVVFVGKLIKWMVIAYACHYGIDVAVLPWVQA